MADQEITQFEFQMLRLKAMLADVLLEQKVVQERIQKLLSDENLIKTKIAELDDLAKKQTLSKNNDDSSILIDENLIDAETGVVQPIKKKK